MATLLYLGVVVTVGAYGLYNFGISRLSATEASGYTNLIPLFTLAFAVPLLGETLNTLQMLAAAVLFGGVALSQWRGATPVPVGVLD
jgi:drug/metabolite transporter (DMT)-like permease